MQLLVYLAEENLCTGPPWTSRIPSSLPPWMPPLSGRYPRSRASRYNFRTLPQPSTSCFSLPSQYLSTEQEEMPRPQTSQKGRAGLLQWPRILLTCSRARISAFRANIRETLKLKDKAEGGIASKNVTCSPEKPLRMRPAKGQRSLL